MKTTDIRIGNKEYTVQVAETEEERSIGLSKTKHLPEDEGMLFVFEDVIQEGWFTMEETSIDLDIIFIDENGEVISVNSVKAFDPNPIEEEGYQYVLEVNIDSGIQEGDELEEIDDEFSEEDKLSISNSKMLVLDENGDVLFTLQSGERIVSRTETKKLIRAALKAYRSDEDSAYKKVGKLIFKILDGQDNRDPEYVQLND